ncbi:hypothetical protein [Flexivirga alba]|uniref:Uncharacterized protein n=1 Tax=Flexivirga alba TaxID=702742 RepID=A0ABW2ALN9_9MICO
MSTGQKQEHTARETALAEVATHGAALAKWTEERGRALAELERLQVDAGVAVLDDESCAVRLPREMQEARDRADIADRAIAAVGPRLQAAREVAVAAEATELGSLIAEARSEVDAFEAKTTRLLNALVKHTGTPWEQLTPEIQGDRFFAQSPGGSFHPEGTRADRELRFRLAVLELQQRVLRAAAAGEDVREMFPELSFAQLPESLRPGGVMPQPGFSDPMAAAVERLRDQEERLAKETWELADLERRIGAIESRVAECAAEGGRLPYDVELNLDELPGLRRDRDRLKTSVVNLPYSIERERAALQRSRAAVDLVSA